MNPLNPCRLSHHGAFAAGFYGVETGEHVQEMKQAESCRKVDADLLPGKQRMSSLLPLIFSALLVSPGKWVEQQITALN